jgi:hypothetical protein
MKSVLFIVSPSTAVLSDGRLESPGTSRKGYRAQGHDKTDIPCGE